MSMPKILKWKIPIKWQGSMSWRRVEKKCMNKKKVCHKKKKIREKFFMVSQTRKWKERKDFFQWVLRSFPRMFRKTSELCLVSDERMRRLNLHAGDLLLKTVESQWISEKQKYLKIQQNIGLNLEPSKNCFLWKKNYVVNLYNISRESRLV